MAREQVKLVSTAKKVAKAKPPLPVTLLDAKGARIGADPWSFLADDQGADQGGDVIVSVGRLMREAESLSNREKGGRLGVKILTSDAIEEIAPYMNQLALVAVDFPIYRDGRGYSTARLARERYHFSGDLRAIGDVLQDQLFAMLRCGFSSFMLKAKDPEAAFAQAARTFSLVYQPSTDRRATIWSRRLGKPT